ncbi:MAG: methyltransferase domain-containing protein [Puniceicoccales bacterium]|nr:methyltransferase domain-containing protein [Puniceicoccales bacterium]
MWRKPQKDENDKLRIAVVVSGCIGDILIYGLVIKELSKHINCDYSIDLYMHERDRKIILDFVFNKACFVSKLMATKTHNNFQDYDAVIGIDRCTYVIHYDSECVEKKSKWLGDFCKKNENFFTKHHKFFEHMPRYHAIIEQWSILNGKSRIQQSDQCKLIGLNNSTHTFLNLEPANLEILKSLKLKNVQYITIQRGVNVHEKLSQSTRMWPIRHYEKFMKLFHQAYPAIKVIQLGYSNDLCKSVEGVDINLIGKTSLDELAVILKHSLFHLDGEGGMVHMKKFLNGRSIAMFGPTSSEIFGYPENINLKGNGCNSWCEWVSDDWDKKCLRGFEEAPCMASISPEMVMGAVNEILNGRKNFSYSVEEDNIAEDKIADHIFSKNADKKIKIVDVFSKNGPSLGKILRKNFDDITIFDMSFQFDSFAKAEKNGLKLEYGCLYNISMPDDSSDIVIWQNKDRNVAQAEYVMKELFRILKPGGMLIVSGVSFQASNLRFFEILPAQCSSGKEATIFSKTLVN